MIYHPNALVTTERLREIPQENQQDFPYIAIQSNLERYVDRCSSWHWHEYFELATVHGGTMELSTQRRTLLIGDGEGYFVNSNVLHLCRVADGSEGAQLRVHQFDGRLIGTSDCVLRRYVHPIGNCGTLDAVKLDAGNGVHARMLKALNEAFQDAGNEPEGYELSISVKLMQVWQDLYTQAAPLLQSGNAVSSTDVSRIKQMLAFIHAHYAEPITTGMIAEAANICVRESHRCFRQTLDTTPILYLLRHRVNAAARLLIETDRSITDIAVSCGFSTPSYFCKVFHDIIGRSPREFRRKAYKNGEP